MYCHNMMAHGMLSLIPPLWQRFLSLWHPPPPTPQYHHHQHLLLFWSLPPSPPLRLLGGAIVQSFAQAQVPVSAGGIVSACRSSEPWRIKGLAKEEDCLPRYLRMRLYCTYWWRDRGRDGGEKGGLSGLRWAQPACSREVSTSVIVCLDCSREVSTSVIVCLGLGGRCIYSCLAVLKQRYVPFLSKYIFF